MFRRISICIMACLVLPLVSSYGQAENDAGTQLTQLIRDSSSIDCEALIDELNRAVSKGSQKSIDTETSKQLESCRKQGYRVENPTLDSQRLVSPGKGESFISPLQDLTAPTIVQSSTTYFTSRRGQNAVRNSRSGRPSFQWRYLPSTSGPKKTQYQKVCVTRASAGPKCELVGGSTTFSNINYQVRQYWPGPGLAHGEFANQSLIWSVAVCEKVNARERCVYSANNARMEWLVLEPSSLSITMMTSGAFGCRRVSRTDDSLCYQFSWSGTEDAVYYLLCLYTSNGSDCIDTPAGLERNGLRIIRIDGRLSLRYTMPIPDHFPQGEIVKWKVAGCNRSMSPDSSCLYSAESQFTNF